MSENTFGYGPDVWPPVAVRKRMDAIAGRWDYCVCLYPGPYSAASPRWAFHGPNQGWLENNEAERAIRADLDTDPIIQAWCKWTVEP